MPPHIVIVAYKPKAGKEKELLQLSKEHYARLKEQDLVTERQPVLMQAQDGTIIEVFEWKSVEVMQQAHANKAVIQIWKEYDDVCNYIPVADVAESKNLFSGFAPVL